MSYRCSYFCKGYCYYFGEKVAMECDTADFTKKGYCPYLEYLESIEKEGDENSENAPTE